LPIPGDREAHPDTISHRKSALRDLAWEEMSKFAHRNESKLSRLVVRSITVAFAVALVGA